jgi:uncharacterized SAM-binding protein YcdF (DUF218 family)
MSRPAFDCAVVLGHSADPSDPIMQARVRAGVELYQAGEAPCLIMSGLYSFKLRADPPPVAEARVMRDFALSLGAAPFDVLVEDESTDTLSNAYFTKVRFLAPLAWRNVCLVTSEVHAARALWLFRKVLGPGYRVEVREAVSSNDPDALREGRERNARLLRQVQPFLQDIADGDHGAVADLLFTRHPGYVDDPAATAEVEAALL